MEADDREPNEGKLESNKKEATIAENGIDKSLQGDWSRREQKRNRNGVAKEWPRNRSGKEAIKGGKSLVSDKRAESK